MSDPIRPSVAAFPLGPTCSPTPPHSHLAFVNDPSGLIGYRRCLPLTFCVQTAAVLGLMLIAPAYDYYNVRYSPTLNNACNSSIIHVRSAWQHAVVVDAIPPRFLQRGSLVRAARSRR